MNKAQVYEDLKAKIENVFIDEQMANNTSFRTGGTADILVKPASIEEIQYILEYCNKNEIEHVILGNGTNVLVRDGGIRQLVIKISDNLNTFRINEDEITAGAGTSLIALSHFAFENGLAGLEFACGIPGTLGGAIRMNAGAFKGEMREIVKKSKYMDRAGKIFEISNSEHEFGYRKSIFEDNPEYIIIESTLKLTKGNKEEIKEKMDHNSEIRKAGQPVQFPSAGSSFKRPEGYFPGKLIEDCNLKGYKIGGAEVSTLHANFIINPERKATSKDVLDLMKYVQDTVYAQFNVKLEPEILVLGEDK